MTIKAPYKWSLGVRAMPPFLVGGTPRRDYATASSPLQIPTKRIGHEFLVYACIQKGPAGPMGVDPARPGQAGLTLSPGT